MTGSRIKNTWGVLNPSGTKTPTDYKKIELEMLRLVNKTYIPKGYKRIKGKIVKD